MNELLSKKNLVVGSILLVFIVGDNWAMQTVHGILEKPSATPKWAKGTQLYKHRQDMMDFIVLTYLSAQSARATVFNEGDSVDNAYIRSCLQTIITEKRTSLVDHVSKERARKKQLWCSHKTQPDLLNAIDEIDEWSMRLKTFLFHRKAEGGAIFEVMPGLHLRDWQLTGSLLVPLVLVSVEELKPHVCKDFAREAEAYTDLCGYPK